MAGQGPAPKVAGRRARRNADPVPQTVLTFHPSEAPDLPDTQPDGIPWPPATVRWWNTWKDSAQAELMTATDWSFLLDTAILHARLWAGEVSNAPELRLRVAKFGATLEDRARLRIVFATADEADGGQPKSKHEVEAAKRYGNLRVLRPGAGASDSGPDAVARA